MPEWPKYLAYTALIVAVDRRSMAGDVGSGLAVVFLSRVNKMCVFLERRNTALYSVGIYAY